MNTFPVLAGMGWDIKKRIITSVAKDESASGSSFRSTRWVLPHFEFDIPFNFLSQSDKETLEAFIIGQNGPFSAFLLGCVNNDNGQTAKQLTGTANGVNTAFKAPLPPQTQITGVPALYVNDWEGNQLQYTTARTNRILWSGDLTNAAWTKSNTTVTGSAITAPDGVGGAAKVIANASSVVHYVDTSTYTPADNALLSCLVFVKKADYDYVKVELYHKAGGAAGIVFQFSTATITSTTPFGGSTFSVTALANGWYCIRINGMSASAGATAPRMRVYNLDNTGAATFAGDGIKGTYVWGGQIEQAAVAGSYIATGAATATVTDYSYDNLGNFTMAVAPVTGAVLTWTGAYAYVVYFTEDSVIEFSQCWDKGYEGGSITVRTDR